MALLSDKFKLKPQLSGADIKSLYEAEADTNAYTDAEKTKLAGIADGAEVNVNADWNAVSGDAQILNKPTLGTAAATDSTDYATAAQGALADTALQPDQEETISGNYTFNGALFLPNNSRINGTEHFYQTTKPTARGDSSALVPRDRWWKTDDGTEWFWNGTYWLSDLKTVSTQPVQSVTNTTGGFPFVIESYSANILITYYKVYFYLNPGPLSNTDYHVLRLYRGGTALYDLVIKAGDDGALSGFITKTTPILNIVTTRDSLTVSFRYDAGNGTPPTINTQPIPIRLFYHLIHD